MMILSRNETRQMQIRLNRLGVGDLVVDGLFGPKTRRAVVVFKKRFGLEGPNYLGGDVWKAMFGKRVEAKVITPAWMVEAQSILGRHENRDNAFLRKWLGSDGSTIGDPGTVPWCGDFVETCIRKALPNEQLIKNPYLAMNWARWGVSSPPRFGAVLSFWRGSPSSWKGHVGFYTGEDLKTYTVLGGNQGNAVSLTKILKKRLRPDGCRWPATYETKGKLAPSKYGDEV